MTTYNWTNGSITGQPRVNDTLPNTTGPFVRSNVVDFANQNATSTSVSQVINIPADTWVMNVVVRNITAESTANASVKVGSGLDVDSWGTAVAVTSSATPKDIIYSPKYFASADTIDLIVNSTTLDNAKLEIIALMVPGNKSDNDGMSQHST